MEINEKKTQIMLVGHPKYTRKIGNISIKLGNTTVTSVSEIKCLGLHIDCNLNWTQHVNSVVKKCNSKLWALYPIQNLLNVSNRTLLVNAYVYSTIRYMYSIYGTFNKQNENLIESIIRKCGRFILRLNKTSKVKLRISEELKLLFPKFLYQYEVLKIAHSIIKRNKPEYFSNFYDLSNNCISYTTRRCKYVTSNKYKLSNSFKFNSTNLWLNLPEQLQAINDNFTFKNKLFEYLIELQTLEFDLAESHHNFCDLSCIDDVISRFCT